MIAQIGFGGSCHWCTEAIFLSLKGINRVDQGWIASSADDSSFSEAVIVHFDNDIISLKTLIAIHLYTHSCTATHAMRWKYRSAIYTTSDEQQFIATATLQSLQSEYSHKIITKVIPLKDFRLNSEEYLNYYFKDTDKPFCKNIVNPKLRLLLKNFSNSVDSDKLQNL